MLIRTEAFRRPPAAAAEITFGTTQNLVRNSTYENNYTFTGLTGITGYGKAILLFQYNIAWATRASAIGTPTITLNGSAASVVTASSYDSGTDRYKYTQTCIAYIDDPTNGSLAFSFSGPTFRILRACLMPVDNAAAGAAAFGTPVTTLVASNSTTLANSLTTVVANSSWRIGAFSSRLYDVAAYTLADTSHTKVVEESLYANSDDLSSAIFRKQNGATGSKNLGLTWPSSGQADDWSSGHSFELKAA